MKLQEEWEVPTIINTERHRLKLWDAGLVGALVAAASWTP